MNMGVLYTPDSQSDSGKMHRLPPVRLLSFVLLLFSRLVPTSAHRVTRWRDLGTVLDGEDAEPFHAEVDLEYFEKGFFIDEVD